ncbi:hypothetical protein As57867_004716, partial [Aphanomyces stellatus]
MPPTPTRRRGKGWTDPETTALLDVIELIKPLGSDHWEGVQSQYNARAAEEGDWIVRDVAQIRRKYKTLRNTRKPTGDPDCPIHVKRAKRIHAQIEARQSVLDFPLGSGDDSDEDEGIDDPPSQATPRTGLTPQDL